MSGVGAAVAVAVLAAVLVGSAFLVRLLRRQNRQISGGGRSADPFTVGEPWRQHVAAAQASQRRYRTQVDQLPPGPLKARMAEIGRQVEHGVAECWEVARRGHQLDAAIRDVAPASLRVRLERAAPGTREHTSLTAQLASVDRIRAARDATETTLRELQTRLGELVTQAAELTSGVGGAPIDASGTAELGTAVDDVVTQLEALRLAVREVNEPIAGLDGGSPATG